jgi:hypothetical protein
MVEVIRTSRQEQGRGGQLPLAGFTGFGRLIDGWYLVTRHVYVPCFSRARRTGGGQFVDRASMHNTIIPRMQHHAYLSLNETLLAVSSHD